MSLFSHRIGWVLFVACLLIIAFPAILKAQNDPSEQTWQRDFGSTHDQRMKWWREARFGMFIHWGVYSVPAGVWKGEESKLPIEGSWGLLSAKREPYPALAVWRALLRGGGARRSP